MDCVHQVKGCGARVLLKKYEVIKIEVSICFNFENTNNQSKYKACLARLQHVAEIGTQEILLRSDLKVVISQINREYKAMGQKMQRYLCLVK